MTENKKRIIATSIIIIPVILLILVGALYFLTEKFVFSAIYHIYFRMLVVPIIVKIIQKCFADKVKSCREKVLIWCGAVMFLDLVVVDAIRFILSSGENVILFLPACVPVCLMIIMLFVLKGAGEEQRNGKKLTFFIGIPLLVMSLYFEIVSFL